VSDPRVEFSLIAKHEGNQCPDVFITSQYPTIQAAWNSASDEHLWWGINAFLSPCEAGRLLQVWRSVPEIVHSATASAGGLSSSPFPSERLITQLQRRLLLSFQPSLRELIMQANPPPNWAKMLLNKIPERQWQGG
jgi:hypothetical protein